MRIVPFGLLRFIFALFVLSLIFIHTDSAVLAKSMPIKDPDSSLSSILYIVLSLFPNYRHSQPTETLQNECSSITGIDGLISEQPGRALNQIDESLWDKCVDDKRNPADAPLGELDIDLSAPLPLGKCAGIAGPAINKVLSSTYLMDTYHQASAATGVPWVILAAIHYVEAGNNPNGSLISGRPIGMREPDDNNRVYGSLLETAVASAREFKQKQSIAQKSSGGEPYDFETLVGAFALYNGPGNSQCEGVVPKALASGYKGCPAEFKYEDHIYPLACFDDKHAQMNVIYCGDGRQCSTQTPYQKIGGLTFIKSLQKQLGTESFNTIEPSQDKSFPINTDLVYYPQCNGSTHSASWTNKYMTDRRGNNIGCTYCKASCGLASSAMIVSTYGQNKVDPVQFLYTYNTSQNMTCGGAFLPTLGTTLKKYGITVGGHIAFNQASLSNDLFIQKAKSYLQNGWTLLTLGYFNGGGHYVWIVGIDDQDRFLIYDPYWGVNSPLPFNSKNYASARITYITPVKK